MLPRERIRVVYGFLTRVGHPESTLTPWSRLWQEAFVKGSPLESGESRLQAKRIDSSTIRCSLFPSLLNYKSTRQGSSRLVTLRVFLVFVFHLVGIDSAEVRIDLSWLQAQRLLSVVIRIDSTLVRIDSQRMFVVPRAGRIDSCMDRVDSIAKEELWRNFQDHFTKKLIRKPRYLPEGLIPEDRYPVFWRLMEKQHLRGLLSFRERYYTRLRAAVATTLRIENKLDEDGDGEFHLVFKLVGVKYALDLDEMASIWGLRHKGVLYNGGGNPPEYMGRYYHERAIQML
ncbi:hypothetical protein PIB30_060442 [Stylosanthes scabra]|uniref:Uncharacterized protein n=1 Tax=Stylosanthes scabra TaxID=79078 RepID=A0ABU6WND1_9FABA|nr:hypothetical protein [Stylosanthes scabra]